MERHTAIAHSAHYAAEKQAPPASYIFCPAGLSCRVFFPAALTFSLFFL
ncbi:MAG: hypothetical protein MRZ24_02300 [Clostridiales bacterium]|nr:hypothetical protein [Clostridiales bacterium]